MKFEVLEDRSVPAVNVLGGVGALAISNAAADPPPPALEPVFVVQSTPTPIVSPTSTSSSGLPSVGGSFSAQDNPGAAINGLIAQTAINQAQALVGTMTGTAATLDAQTLAFTSVNLARNPLVVDRVILGLGSEAGLGTPVGSGTVLTSPATTPGLRERSANRLSESLLDPNHFRFYQGHWWNLDIDNQWLYWDGSSWLPFEQGSATTARGNSGGGTVTR